MVNESLEELYHFTNYNNIVNILFTDTLHGSDEVCSDGSDPKFISLTRSRISSIGYPYGMNDDKIIRIVLDGRALQSRYKIRSYDYFGSSRCSSKTLSMKTSWRNPDQFNLDDDTIYRNPNVEAEDRIFLDAGVTGISNISRYIKEIQIKKGDFHGKDTRKLKDLCSKRHIDLEVLEPRDFEYGRRLRK